MSVTISGNLYEQRSRLKHDRVAPRVAFTEFDHGIPRRAVYIRGTARVIQAPMAELEFDFRPVTERYVAAEKLDATLVEYDTDRDKAVVTCRQL